MPAFSTSDHHNSAHSEGRRRLKVIWTVKASFATHILPSLFSSASAKVFFSHTDMLLTSSERGSSFGCARRRTLIFLSALQRTCLLHEASWSLRNFTAFSLLCVSPAYRYFSCPPHLWSCKGGCEQTPIWAHVAEWVMLALEYKIKNYTKKLRA